MHYIVKITRGGGQTRINIPKMLAKEADFENIDYVILERVGKTKIIIGRFIDGEYAKRQKNLIGDG